MSEIMADRYQEDFPKTPVVTPDATTAANAVGSNGEAQVKKSSGSGSHTSFSSMDDLRNKEPEFYNLMMQGSVISFIKKQEASNDRIKQANREMYRNN